MRFWGKPKPETFTVLHWPNGYKHEHAGGSPEEALLKAMECAGHPVTMDSVRTSAAFMQVHGDRLEYVPTGRAPQIFRLVRG